MSYTITGKVIRGDGYGEQIGFPTINLSRNSFARMKNKPRHGVYRGRVTLGDKKNYRAGIVIGPLDKNNLPKIEAHLIGFSGNLYGQTVTLEIDKFIRKFKNFKTEKELVAQIKKDLKKC